MKLFSENLPGNLHEVTAYINKHCPEIIPGIVTLDCHGPYAYTILVYRANSEAKLFEKLNLRQRELLRRSEILDRGQRHERR